jgi:hypothetical protein
VTFQGGERRPTNQECYRNTALDCINLIKKKMDVLIYANALREEPTVDLDGDED